MRYQDSVFNQLLKVLPSHKLDRLIEKHKGDFRVRKLGCREQFLALLYCQLTARKSLRDIEVNFNANRQQFYHLGCRSEIKKSTLADANNSRPTALYEELFQWFVAEGLSGKYKKEATHTISLIDSSTVSLNKVRFGWATGHGAHSGIKIHTVYDLDAEIPVHFEVTPSRQSDIKFAQKLQFNKDGYYVFDRGYYDFQLWKNIDDSEAYFVTRLKKNSPTNIIRRFKVPEDQENILSDNEVMLNQRLAKSRKNPYGKNLRELKIKIEGKKDPMRVITNDFKSTASDIALLYKKRWQIELFFKWIKQNLKIKSFLGTTENAVRIQILVAMIAYILLRLFSQQASYQEMNPLTISRLVQTCLMRRVNLYELLHPEPFCPPGKLKKTQQESFSFA